MADADRLLATARHAQAGCAADSPDRDRIVAAAQLLGPLLHQDVDRPGPGVRLKQGVSRDRIVSVHDPEMRHGRKSSSQRFDGHKAAVAVDPESQLITAVAVLPGNAPDAQGALQLVAQSEQHTGLPVTAAMADTAYGDGHTRQQFADAGRTLIAKVRKPPARPHFPKEDFQIDLAAGTCTCPAGQVTRTVRRHGFYATATGAQAPRRSFHFDAALCTACPLRPRGVAAAPGRGRQVSLHPQSAPAVSPVAGRPHLPAECGFRTLSPPPPGRGAPPGPAGATGAAPGPVPRASQDRRPALSHRHRRQPDPHPGRHLTPPPRDSPGSGRIRASDRRRHVPRPLPARVKSPGPPFRPHLTPLFPRRGRETTPPLLAVPRPQKGTSRLDF